MKMRTPVMPLNLTNNNIREKVNVNRGRERLSLGERGKERKNKENRDGNITYELLHK